jgi:hypothetical protein
VNVRRGPITDSLLRLAGETANGTEGGGPSHYGLRSFQLQESAFAYNKHMEQVAKPERLEQDERSNRNRPLVFLDTNVISGYLRGDPSAA